MKSPDCFLYKPAQMNTMQKIAELLDHSREWEDEFILKYDSEIFWELLKTLPKEKFEKVKELLSENIKDTRNHAAILKKLIENREAGKLGK